MRREKKYPAHQIQRLEKKILDDQKAPSPPPHPAQELNGRSKIVSWLLNFRIRMFLKSAVMEK